MVEHTEQKIFWGKIMVKGLVTQADKESIAAAQSGGVAPTSALAAALKDKVAGINAITAQTEAEQEAQEQAKAEAARQQRQVEAAAKRVEASQPAPSLLENPAIAEAIGQNVDHSVSNPLAKALADAAKDHSDSKASVALKRQMHEPEIGSHSKKPVIPNGLTVKASAADIKELAVPLVEAQQLNYVKPKVYDINDPLQAAHLTKMKEKENGIESEYIKFNTDYSVPNLSVGALWNALKGNGIEGVSVKKMYMHSNSKELGENPVLHLTNGENDAPDRLTDIIQLRLKFAENNQHFTVAFPANVLDRNELHAALNKGEFEFAPVEEHYAAREKFLNTRHGQQMQETLANTPVGKLVAQREALHEKMLNNALLVTPEAQIVAANAINPAQVDMKIITPEAQANVDFLTTRKLSSLASKELGLTREDKEWAKGLDGKFMVDAGKSIDIPADRNIAEKSQAAAQQPGLATGKV